VAGIVLGVLLKSYGSQIGLSLDFVDEKAFHIVTDLGIFFLMLLAGLELHPQQISKSSKDAVGLALGGLLLPFALG
jgi:Kef-type K+ transport system membrane component KefB